MKARAGIMLASITLATLTAPVPARPAPAGLNVAILVDVTASQHRCPEGVAGLVSTTLAGSASSARGLGSRAFIAPAVEEFPLRGPRKGDRVRVGALSRRMYLSEPLAGDSPDLKKAWSSVFALPPVEWLGPSPVWDEVVDVAQLLSRESGARTIILVSDGQVSGNRRSAAEAAATAVRFGVRVSVVAEESVMSTTPPQTTAQAIGKDPTARLEELAQKSGGGFFLDKAVITPSLPCFMRVPGERVTQALADLRIRAR